MTGAIDSPFVWFFGRLWLVWPEKLVGLDEISRARGVIAHELAHIRRGDQLLAWIELLAGVFWWWNPLFWFVRNRVRESAELACDAIALSAQSESRRAYAELLIRISSGSGMPTLAPVLGIRAGSTASFERRLSMVFSDRVSGTLPVWGLVAAAAFAIVSLPGLSLARQPAETIAAKVEQGPTSTAARLEQIEAELKRVSRMLEEAKRSAHEQSQTAKDLGRGDRAARPRDSAAEWNRLQVTDKHSTVITFQGWSCKYVLSTDEKESLAEPRSTGKIGKSGEKRIASSSPRLGRVVAPGIRRSITPFRCLGRRKGALQLLPRCE